MVKVVEIKKEVEMLVKREEKEAVRIDATVHRVPDFSRSCTKGNHLFIESQRT